jgi:hypothetical protein
LEKLVPVVSKKGGTSEFFWRTADRFNIKEVLSLEEFAEKKPFQSFWFPCLEVSTCEQFNLTQLSELGQLSESKN